MARGGLKALLSLVFLVGVATPASASGQNDASARALRLSSLTDLVFTDLFLFERHVSSKPRCASVCLNWEGCAAFTVTTEPNTVTTEPNTVTAGASAMSRCRGHVILTSEMSGVNTAGSQAFVFQSTSAWLDQLCAESSDCPLPDTECVEDRCLCSPGFYYSSTKDGCVLGCTLGELGGRFLTYLQHKLFSSKLYEGLEPSLQRCKLLCLTHSLCRSIDYRKSTLRCRLHAVTPEEKPSGFKQDSLVDYLQRTCL